MHTYASICAKKSMNVHYNFIFAFLCVFPFWKHFFSMPFSYENLTISPFHASRVGGDYLGQPFRFPGVIIRGELFGADFF